MDWEDIDGICILSDLPAPASDSANRLGKPDVPPVGRVVDLAPVNACLLFVVVFDHVPASNVIVLPHLYK